MMLLEGMITPPLHGEAEVQGKRPHIVMWANLDEIELLRAHDDVARLETGPTAEGEGAILRIGLWLRPEANDPEVDCPQFKGRRPGRPRDLEFGGEGLPHATFWSRWTGAEHLDLFHEAEGDEHSPYGWWVAHIWLKPAHDA